MRGKAHWLRAGLLEHRITPAYAGKSQAGSLSHKRIEDHPRLCGEKFLTRNSQTPEKGSPPPMRGKDRVSSAVQAPCRITPAYAGKRRKLTKKEVCNGDHPRLCGEKNQNLVPC